MHPEVAYRPCEMCLKYMYDHKTGKLLLDADGNPRLRPTASKAPCQYVLDRPTEIQERACGKISPTGGIELNEQNQRAYDHYRECRAVGHFPNDPIVRQNARYIRDLEDAHQASQMQMAMYSGRV